MPQETKKTLIESINTIQTDIKLFVKKDATNEFNKYNYFTESNLYEILKPKLKEQDITYTIQAVGEPTFFNSGKDDKFVNYYSKGLLTLYKGNEKIELGITLSAQNTDMAKAVGSALTYGARYWLCKTFGIATDELDPDSTEISKINSKQEKEQKEIINNSNSMSLEHFNNIKNFLTNTKTDKNIISEAKKFIKEKCNATELKPVIIKKQSEDFYYQFKERFLL